MISLVLSDHNLWRSWLEAMREFDGAQLQGFSTFGLEDEDLSTPEGDRPGRLRAGDPVVDR